MKRFTDTATWDKEWFQELPPKLKCLWLFLCARCDNAGVWDTNFRLASFIIGEQISADDMDAFNGNVERLDNGKYWLPAFVSFQYGRLSGSCKPHKQISELIQKHGLHKRVAIPFEYAINSVQEKEQEKDKDKEKETKRKRKHLFSNSPYAEFDAFRAALEDWTEQECSEYYEQAKDYSAAHGKMYVDWIAAVRNWKRKADREGGTRGTFKSERQRILEEGAAACTLT